MENAQIGKAPTRLESTTWDGRNGSFEKKKKKVKAQMGKAPTGLENTTRDSGNGSLKKKVN